MLRIATWLLRAAVLAGVGLESFTGSTAHGNALDVQIVAFTAGAALVVAWGAMSQRRPAPPATTRSLPWVFGAMAICAAPCTVTDGGAMIAFGFMAAIGAGADSSVIAGWTVSALGVVSIVTGGLIDGSSTTKILGNSALVLVALLAGHNRRAYRVQAEHNAILLEQSEQLRVEQRQVAMLDERNRIAREIHDVLAHSLGALGIQIQTARAVLSDQGDVDRTLAALETAQRMASDGLTETRRAVHALRNDSRPLPEELTALVEHERERRHAGVGIAVTGTARALTPDAELALLRTAQESFVNAAKHSAGQPVEARLDYAGHETSLTITNRLAEPIDVTAKPGSIDGGYGLVGMRERLLLLGGSLVAGPDTDHWTVTATVPQ